MTYLPVESWPSVEKPVVKSAWPASRSVYWPWLETNFGSQPYVCFRPTRQSVRWRHSGNADSRYLDPAFSTSSDSVLGLPSFFAVSLVAAILYVFSNGVCVIGVMSSLAR